MHCQAPEQEFPFSPCNAGFLVTRSTLRPWYATARYARLVLTHTIPMELTLSYAFASLASASCSARISSTTVANNRFLVSSRTPARVT